MTKYRGGLHVPGAGPRIIGGELSQTGGGRSDAAPNQQQAIDFTLDDVVILTCNQDIL